MFSIKVSPPGSIHTSYDLSGRKDFFDWTYYANPLHLRGTFQCLKRVLDERFALDGRSALYPGRYPSKRLTLLIPPARTTAFIDDVKYFIGVLERRVFAAREKPLSCCH